MSQYICFSVRENTYQKELDLGIYTVRVKFHALSVPVDLIMTFVSKIGRVFYSILLIPISNG